MTRANVYWSIATALVAATFAASIWVYPTLPETVPTHWNLHNQVDGYGSKSVPLFLLPFMAVGMLVLFRFLPALSPKPFALDTFRDTYVFLAATTIGLFAYVHGVILYATWSQVTGAAGGFNIGRALFAGMFPFLGLMGNVMGKVRRNFYVGIKAPWTLASDRVWNDTHRLAAWTMVVGSALGFLLVLSGLPLVFPVAVLLATFMVPLVYSFVHYKQLERRGEL